MGFDGITRLLFVKCEVTCMSVPTKNLVWVSLWYLPMHFALVTPLSWRILVAAELYSKALIASIFYLSQGPSMLKGNSQVVFYAMWIWLMWMSALYYTQKRQMVVFIQREHLMKLAAREEKDALAKNLLWIL